MNNEDISALVDDEIDADGCAAMIDRLSADADARRAWSRYHLIGSALREPRLPEVNRAAEIVPIAAPRRRLATPLAGLALAASVAVIAVTLVLRSAGPAPAPGFDVAEHAAPLAPAGDSVAAVAAAPAAATVSSLTSAPAANVVPVGAYDQRLNGYLVNFNEQRARRGVPGVHPYVRIVGFEAE